MDEKQYKFGFLSKMNISEFHLIKFAVLFMVLFSIFLNIFYSLKNIEKIDLVHILESIGAVTFVGIFFSIPQIIARKKSEKYRLYLYELSGKKRLSLLSSFFYYIILSFFISILFSIIVMSILSVIGPGAQLLYPLKYFLYYIFISLFSFIVGGVFLIKGSRKSEIIPLKERVPVKFYLFSYFPILPFILCLVLFIFSLLGI